jgi:hypothetical protein
MASDIAKLDEIVHQAARAVVDRQLIHLPTMADSIDISIISVNS